MVIAVAQVTAVAWVLSLAWELFWLYRRQKRKAFPWRLRGNQRQFLEQPLTLGTQKRHASFEETPEQLKQKGNLEKTDLAYR